MPVIGPNASQLRAGVQAAIQVADEEEFERQLASSTVRSHEKAEEQLRAFGEQSVAEQRRKGDLSIPADLDQYLRSDTPFPDQFWSALTHWACKRFDGDIGRTSTTITIVFYGFYCRSKPEARVGSRIREAVKSIVMHHPSVRPPDEKKYVASSDYEQILGFGASRQMKPHGRDRIQS
ncbi:hypothetical protein PSEUBRA_003221 [Kalmanozyma brasiliensis GHG001]|uniref:uncharacterized protein n=1 Tax=Kalmanozyma brasiliensis (strain GHG001) TaxID=1365824 RepID=UPI001CE90FA6|nr:uncharacterized protein PSEUBRA_003221 [Kalmanozyma brasiliensis GHG001]KAF6767203.1 hypothetical protein PSEUBRA_003221 [Kalmanozyma brasiliensis GHG001]